MSSCGQLEAPCFEDDNLSNLSNHYTNFNTAFLLIACATTTPDQTRQEKKRNLVILAKLVSLSLNHQRPVRESVQ